MQVREVKCALHQRYQIRNLGWSPCIIFILLYHLCSVKVKQHHLTFWINFFCKSAVCMSRQGLCHSIRIFIRILLSDIYCIWQTRTKIYTKTAMMSVHQTRYMLLCRVHARHHITATRWPWGMLLTFLFHKIYKSWDRKIIGTQTFTSPPWPQFEGLFFILMNIALDSKFTSWSVLKVNFS